MTGISYRVVRSPRRRRLTISVERDCAVVVHAPAAMSDEEVRRIVGEKRQWILGKVRHPQKYQEQKHPPGKELVNGESTLYLGREYRIELIDTASGDIELSTAFHIPEKLGRKRREELRAWYIARAREVIQLRAARHARELGVRYFDAKIVDNRFRWGACTPRNSVHFNWRLIKAPMAVVDYVIVHELAHLLEGNHTATFWNIVRSKCPSMDKAKAWLKEHGQLLEQEI